MLKLGINKDINYSDGQIMLLMVLVLTSVILMVAATAGIIMSFNLRQVTDARLSSKAISAADTGIECVLDNYFCVSGDCPNTNPKNQACPNLQVSSPGGGWKNCSASYIHSDSEQKLTDGSYYDLKCQMPGGQQSSNYSSIWTAVGYSPNGRVSRSLQIEINRL